jgi:hypothetical protein
MTPVRALVLFARLPENETISYQRAWPRHFAAHPRFDCDLVDVLSPRDTRRLRLASKLGRGRYEAIVILHSVFSNGRYLHGPLLDLVRRQPATKAYFVGNEYKGMPEKMWFCDELGLDLLVSQFTTEGPLRLYRRRLPTTKVVGIPNTGWDADLFAPRLPPAERPVDLGYRAFDNDVALGHRERRALAERFLEVGAANGLVVDISLDPADRLDEPRWAAFLNRCRGQIGSEAGGDYFELTDVTRQAVNAYLAERPEATFEDIWSRFFRDHPSPVKGRVLSGRNVEAAGTKTVQLLLEGDYGGYLEPDVHYIPLRKDFTDLDDALEKFADEPFCERLRERAFEVAQDLTYPKLIDRFHDALAPLVR